MKWRRTLAVLLLSAVVAGSSQAGINFFGKKPKVDPNVRVAELLGILKSDADEHKRAAAAEELREFDGTSYPDMIPVLIEALTHDAKASVRAEAAQSLGKIRPINPNAGAALEQALAKDSSMRVRLQARSALLSYNWAGYKSKSKDTPPLYQTGEPPLADPPPASGKAPAPLPPPTPVQSKPLALPLRKAPVQTPPPPPAQGKIPSPLPTGPKTDPMQQGPDLGLPPGI